MRRCIIHIGHAKTATTYLQHCLHLNTALFARHNYWVPSDFTALGAYDLAPLAEQGKIMSGNLAPLHELLTEGPGDQVGAMEEYLFAAPGMPPDCDILLSSELLFYYWRIVLYVARTAISFGLAPEIIAYLPRQDHAAVSGYLQNVRFHGFTSGVAEFLLHDVNIPYCRYLAILRKFADALPDVAITLRTFNTRFLASGDVFTDLLEAVHCRVDPADCVRPDRISNPGLLLEHYELIRAATILGRADAVHRLRSAEITLAPLDRARLAGYYYRPSLQKFLTEQFHADNNDMLDRFMPAASEAERSYWRHFDPAAAPVSLDRALFEQLRAEAFG